MNMGVIEELGEAFQKQTNSDLFVYYQRIPSDDGCSLNSRDMNFISDLLTYHNPPGNKSVNLMLQTLGGNILVAIGLMKLFRERYPEGVRSFVIEVAKSSGAFMALSSDKCFMNKGAVVSDFRINPSMGVSSDVNLAHGEATSICFRGLCGRVNGEYFLKNLAFSPVHAKPISREEAVENIGVSKITEYEHDTSPLRSIHNGIIETFQSNSNIKKIFGFNKYFYSMP